MAVAPSADEVERQAPRASPPATSRILLVPACTWLGDQLVFEPSGRSGSDLSEQRGVKRVRRLSFRHVTAGAIVLAIVVAACGSSAKKTAGSSAAPTSAPSTKAASGAPITVGFINQVSASASTITGTAGAQAAVAYVNEELGGVHGR